jgi:hypothetical protein
VFGDLPFSLAEENLQSRTRGNLLMGIANKFGYILLNTSNKSELSTGYGTLYGDMAGGLSVLGDVYKMQVYALEDTPQGTIVVYFPDVVQTAVSEKILAAGASSGHYNVPNGTGPLQLTPIDAETRDLTLLCKAMVGWGRRALRVEFGTAAQEAHVRAVENMCKLAAQKWATSV